jgi:anaerobic selenocysteine-containing dehydrogenase
MTTVTSICRSCLAMCPILVEVEDGRAVKVTGDRDAIAFDGYTCPKGRALPEQTNSPHRLLHSVKRTADGGFDRIGVDQAIEEIAGRLRAIIDEHGPRSVAMYVGNGSGVQHPFSAVMAALLLRELGSPMMFSPSTIDKPGEKISAALHGYWMGGAQAFADSDVWMIVGANPILAKSNGLPYNNPAQRLKEALARGLKLIAVDPRRTECARRAHVHLQARPGEDPTILAGMIRSIIDMDLHDKEFVADNVAGFETLKAAVAPFTPDYVEQRAGVSAADLIEAARTFGSAKRGMAVSSTGPSFSPRGNLSFYLTLCLNSICGRWVRAGERAVYPNVLLPAFEPKAQAMPPYPVFTGNKLRVMGLTESAAGMPCTALADEITTQGEGQVRALICFGGNPVSAFPDQRRTEHALASLDLLVALDVQLSATAKLAHYVIAPPMALELPAMSYSGESMKYQAAGRGYQNCWAQYTPAAVDPPARSELIPEHAFFFRLARALGYTLTWVNYHGLGKYMESPPQMIPLDMDHVPSLDEIYELATVNSHVPLAEIKKHPHGKTYDIDVRVSPRDPGWEGKLQVADPIMMAELAEVSGEDWQAQRRAELFPFQLVCHRANNTMNSIGADTPGLLKGKNHNPLMIHPDDAASLGIADGDVVTIRSREGTALAVAEADETLRRGVVALTHGFGARGADAERDPRIGGTNVNLLIDHQEIDPISGIPRMSAIPVAIVAAA